MKIWKVYGRNCVSTKPVKEITKEDAKELINEQVNWIMDGVNCSEEEFDSKYEETLSRAEKYFEETGVFGCGDFNIVIMEDDEYPTRPNIAQDTGIKDLY